MYKDYSALDDDVSGISAIKNSIQNIILTPRGSLPGKPRFGSDLYKVLFSQIDALTINLAKNYIKEALSEYEDRISVESVTIKEVPEFNRLVITIKFSYTDTVYDVDEYTDSVSISVSL